MGVLCITYETNAPAGLPHTSAPVRSPRPYQRTGSSYLQSWGIQPRGASGLAPREAIRGQHLCSKPRQPSPPFPDRPGTLICLMIRNPL